MTENLFIINDLLTRLERLERGNAGLKGGSDYPYLSGYVNTLLTPSSGAVSTTSGSHVGMYQYATPDQNPTIMATFEASVSTGTANVRLRDTTNSLTIANTDLTNTSTQTFTLSGDLDTFSYATLRKLRLEGRIVSGGGTLTVTLLWLGGSYTP